MRINVYSYLEEKATVFPDKCAIQDDKNELNFGEWHRMAESLGTVISGRCDNCLRKPVLVFVDRRIEGLVGFMGVMASGNFYVPIDSKMPALRINLIIGILNPVAAITITEKDKNILQESGFKGEVIDYSASLETEPDSMSLKNLRNNLIDLDPVYSIFTSGSTGVPKGVIISHRGMIDLADWLSKTFDVKESDVIGNQTPFYFDGSVKDICLCLKEGATLSIIGKKYFSFPKLLIEYLNNRKISCILWATSAITLVGNTGILNERLPEHIRLVTFAGEAMPAKQLNHWMDNLPDARFFNLYGPTEITVDCTYYEVTHKFPDDSFIPIGKACRNMEIIVLNDKDEKVTGDEEGELCVRGTGVAMGYFNNLVKSDEVFTQNPLNPYYRDIIYRTGDMVRYDAEGNLIFISRKDFQIKHMGNRIELGEIEAAVNAIEGVTNAACIFSKKNDRIILYYTTEDNSEIDIILKINKVVPKYMLPNECHLLDRMPYNLNDKIDRLELKRLYENSANLG